MVDTAQDPPPANGNGNSKREPADEHRGSNSPSGKRNKREWLAFKGAKHSRVGNDFQVTDFPSPKDDGADDKKTAAEPEEKSSKETKPENTEESVEQKTDTSKG